MMWNPYTGQYESQTCQAASNLIPHTTCEPAQPSDPNMRNVYRFFFSNSKDHMLTLSWNEGANAGGTYEGIAFRVYVNPTDSNMYPLYRCYWSAKVDHFVSPQSNCEGLKFEGVYGYVSSIPRPGLATLYRLWMPSWTNHLSTTNLGEVNSGALNEGIQGYVP
jgi:hypothetical protein